MDCQRESFLRVAGGCSSLADPRQAAPQVINITCRAGYTRRHLQSIHAVSGLADALDLYLAPAGNDYTLPNLSEQNSSSLAGTGELPVESQFIRSDQFMKINNGVGESSIGFFLLLAIIISLFLFSFLKLRKGIALMNQSQMNVSRVTQAPLIMNNSEIQQYLVEQKRNPDSSKIANKLVVLYQSQIDEETGYLWQKLRVDPKQIVSSASSEVVQLKILLAHSSPLEDRLTYLELLAESEVTANQCTQAAATAQLLLKYANRHISQKEPSNAVYAGNEVLGRIAARHNHWNLAANYLIKAGAVKGEPNAIEVGPNMRLARTLLIHGNRSVVIKFLNECKASWRIDGAKEGLNEWIQEIREGHIPSFDVSM